MTLSEFKAWFEGFSEMMEGAPNEAQWERIKSRVNEISSGGVDRTVFFERYYPPYRQYWSAPYVGTPQTMLLSNSAYDVSGTIDHGNGTKSQSTPSKPAFDSFSAMRDLGKAEFKAAVAA